MRFNTIFWSFGSGLLIWATLYIMWNALQPKSVSKLPVSVKRLQDNYCLHGHIYLSFTVFDVDLADW